MFPGKRLFRSSVFFGLNCSFDGIEPHGLFVNFGD